MPVPSTIADLSTVTASNSPQGTDAAKGTIDNYLRSHASFIAQNRDGKPDFVANIQALLTSRQAAGLIAIVRSYHAGSIYGGGAFYWDAARNKAEHNGGSIIDPGAPFPASWSNAAQIAAWYVPTVGAGCWVRVAPEYYPDEFGANYTASVNQTPMIQQAEVSAAAVCKALRLRAVYHELQTQLVIRRAPQIIGDNGGVGSLRSRVLVSSRVMPGAVFVSRVVGTHAVLVRPLTFDFGGQIENLTLIGRYNASEARVAGSGINLDEFGWSAVVNSLTVEDFQDTGVEIGYVQDTTFTRLTVLGCGNTAAKAAIVFNRNSNLLYFRDAHVEDGNYLLRSYASDANGTAWEVHWSGTHFEVGNYTGTPDPTLEHRYATPSMMFEGDTRQWSFEGCTYGIPGASYLSASNGGAISAQPYFMQAANASGFKFNSCAFLAPTTGIDPINLATTAAWAAEFGPNELVNCTFRGVNPTCASFPIKIDRGRVEGGAVIFYTGDASAVLNGIQVASGSVDKVTFYSVGDAAKTSGTLIKGVTNGEVMVGVNDYKLSTSPFIWVSRECNLTDQRAMRIKEITATSSLNMEAEQPGTTYQITGASIAISDITNCQRGRRIRLFNTSGTSITIAQTATLYPNGASSLSVAHLMLVELVTDSSGIVVRN